jgi:hypothetical protein
VLEALKIARHVAVNGDPPAHTGFYRRGVALPTLTSAGVGATGTITVFAGRSGPT